MTKTILVPSGAVIVATNTDAVRRAFVDMGRGADEKRTVLEPTPAEGYRQEIRVPENVTEARVSDGVLLDIPPALKPEIDRAL